MNICVIGAGNVGGTLGKKWAAAGHTLVFGARSPADDKYADLREIGPVVTIPEALAGAEVVLLSLPGPSVADFAETYGAALAGKIVIDATNNVRGAVMNNLDVLRQLAPGAQLVRAFSTLGWQNFAEPEINGTQVDLFYCASPQAQPAAEQLIAEVGLRPVLLGGLETVDLVDGMTRMWFHFVFTQGRGRRLAFKLLEASQTPG